MQRHRLVAPFLALMLFIPAVTAYGADQEVNVRVLPSDTLSVSVDQWADLGGAELGQTSHYDFWLNVINTTDSGFEVTVIGDDLTSFNWQNCDENGCYDPVPTDPLYTIAKSNLQVSGGHLDWWDGDDPTGDTVRSFTASPGDEGTPSTILQATAFAHGEFGMDNPMAYLELTIPADAESLQMYRTVLTYTIAPWTPAP